MDARYSNGNLLSDGDAVTLIKNLRVKGFSLNLNRGTVVKEIRLTEESDGVDCRIDGSSIV